MLSKIEILEAKKEAAVPVSPEQRLVSDGTTDDVGPTTTTVFELMQTHQTVLNVLVQQCCLVASATSATYEVGVRNSIVALMNTPVSH